MERNELALEIAEASTLPDVLSHGLGNERPHPLHDAWQNCEGTVATRHALEVALHTPPGDPAVRAYNNLIATDLVPRTGCTEATELVEGGT